MADRVYILILNWNNWKDTVACLESVFQNAYPDYRVILMDNGSSDGSMDKIKEWALGSLKAEGSLVSYTPSNKPIPFVEYERGAVEKGGLRGQAEGVLTLIQNGADLGVPGNNTGMKHVLDIDDRDYIWLLNNDTVIDKDALAGMVTVAKQNEGIGIVGSKLLYYDRPSIIQVAGGGKLFPFAGNASHMGTNEEDRGQRDTPTEVDFITGASLLIKRCVIEDIGLFDERYFLLWEDIDLNIRARRKGYKCIYCPESRVWHKEGGTVGRISPIMDYYWVRNGLFFGKKFYPIYLPLIIFAYLIKYTLIRIIKNRPLNFRSFINGLLDFVKGKTGENTSYDL